MVGRRTFLQGLTLAITAGGVGVGHVGGDEPARSTPVDETGEVGARVLEPIRDRRRWTGAEL